MEFFSTPTPDPSSANAEPALGAGSYSAVPVPRPGGHNPFGRWRGKGRCGGFCSLIRLAKNFAVIRECYGVGGLVWGSSMEKCRSFYLDSKQNDFAEPIEEACRLDFTDIPLVDAANDNEPARVRLSARSQALIRRLVANLRII